MPQIQLGLYQIPESEAAQCVGAGLAIGYRGFDSAQMYGNERETGRAIRDFLDSSENREVGRADIFYTSKLRKNSASYETVQGSIRKSVAACGLGYIDLFLLHSPEGYSDARLTSWHAVEDAITEGELRAGGVSNYGVNHVSYLPTPHSIYPHTLHPHHHHHHHARQAYFD